LTAAAVFRFAAAAPVAAERLQLMNTRVEDAGPCRKILHVNVEWSEVSADYERLLALYAAEARVPGFRKGRAPVQVVERHYAKGLAEDARDRLLPRFYNAALEAEKLKPVSVVQVADVDLVRSQGFRFRVTVDLPPEFKLPKYRKITLKDQSREVTDADVDRMLDVLRQQTARYEDVEGRPSVDGDLVRIDFEGRTADGRPVAELSADCSGIGAAKDFWAQIGQPEFLPGMAAGLVGLNIGDTRRVDVEFPEGFRIPAAAGKKAAYTVTVKAIRGRHLPDVNEEFAKQLGAESVEAVRTSMRERLKASAENEERSRRHEELSKTLIEKTEMEAPRSLVEGESRQAFYHAVRSMIRQGVPREEVEQRRAEVAATATQVGTDRIKLRFILEAVAREEHIELTDAEFETHLGVMAGQHRVPVESLRAEIERRGEMDEVRTDALCNKVLDALVDMALGRR
jgi:trigger factor